MKLYELLVAIALSIVIYWMQSFESVQDWSNNDLTLLGQLIWLLLPYIVVPVAVLGGIISRASNRSETK